MTVKLKRVFWLGLWLACAVTAEGLHAGLTPEKLYHKVLPSVMTLEVESQSGERFVGSAVLALADVFNRHASREDTEPRGKTVGRLDERNFIRG